MEVNLYAQYMTTPEKAHRHIAHQLHFPRWYGNNLDALWDMLTDISQPCLVSINGAGKLKDSLGDYGSRLLGVMLQASAENDMLTVELL